MSLRCGGCCGSCEFFAVARSDNFSAAAVQAFCHLPEGSRCKGTSRRLRFSNVLQLFSVGSEKNRPSGRTLLQCYGVTVPKIVAMGGVKYLYIYIYIYIYINIYIDIGLFLRCGNA